MKKFGLGTCCLLAVLALLLSKDVPVRAASPDHSGPCGAMMNRDQPSMNPAVPVRERGMFAPAAPKHTPRPSAPIPAPAPIVVRGQTPPPEPAPQPEKRSFLSIFLPHLSLNLDL